MTKYELKPLGVGGILDQAILIFKDHFGFFLKIMLCLQLPMNAAINFFVRQRTNAMNPNPTREEMGLMMQAQFVSLIFISLTMLVVIAVLVPFMNAAIVHATATAYLQQPTRVAGSLRVALSRYLPMVWTSFLVFFFTFVGYLFCLLPGILLTFWFALAICVVVLERRSGLDALERSRHLMRAFWIKHYLTYFLLVLLIGSVSLGINAGTAFIPERHVAAIVEVVLEAVASVFGSIAFVVFYYSCRCRVENLDLFQLADAVAAIPIEPVGSRESG